MADYISDYHSKRRVSLRFSPYANMPNKLLKKWNDLKTKCHGSQHKNEEFMERWIECCQLDSNQQLLILNRSEGGIGGDDNRKNKQLRMYDDYDGNKSRYNSTPSDYTDIIVCEMTNGTDEQWTDEELKDLIDSFLQMVAEYIGCEDYASGYVKIQL